MDKKTKKKAADYRAIVILLAIFTFIGGLLLGIAAYDYILMGVIWASSFVFTVIMLLLVDILGTLEDIKTNIKQ